MAFGFLPSCVQTPSRTTAELPHGQSWQKRGWEKGLAPGGTPVNGSGQGESKQEAVSAAPRPPTTAVESTFRPGFKLSLCSHL